MASIKLKGNPIHTSGNLLKVGDKAPAFTLVNAELQDVTLKTLAGKKKLLSIVPSLDTDVCATSTKKFNDFAKSHPNCHILVISTDLPFAQKRFCQQEKIANVSTLSMMRSKDFGKDYGVLIADGPLAGVLARAILVLDETDKVIYSELVPEITQEPNYDAALSMLD